MGDLLKGVDVSKLPDLYTTESVKPEDKLVVLKFFLPGTRWTWLATEFDPDDRCFFGYVISGLGPDCDEWGYFSLDELESLRKPFMVERDLHFTPKPFGQLTTFEVMR